MSQDPTRPDSDDASPEPAGGAPGEPWADAAEPGEPPADPPVAEAPSPPSEPDDASEAASEAPKAADGASDAGGASKPAEAPPKKAARRRPRDPAIARAFRLGIPVEGKVEQVIKGGYEVRVGKCRAFCPHSQMDVHRVENPEEHVGSTHSFRILQMRRGGEDLVVSRRALIEERREDEAKAVCAALVEGSVIEGRVARITTFGAFVDIGAGVSGLVHLSELSHSRVQRVEDAVSVGDRVRVKILKLDEESGKISLSIRQTEVDPWKDVGSRFPKGAIVEGSVKRFADFGAFVEIAPGVEALAPAREFPPTPGSWRDGLESDVPARWLVLSVDARRRRVSVVPAPPEGEALHTEPPEVGATVKARVQRVERYGVFAWIGPGVVGLVPGPWTGTPRGTDLGKRFPVGSEVEVEVVEISDGGARIRLSIDGAHRTAPDEGRRQAAPAERESREAPKEPEGSFGTSLGDALRAAFDRRGSDT